MTEYSSYNDSDLDEASMTLTEKRKGITPPFRQTGNSHYYYRQSRLVKSKTAGDRVLELIKMFFGLVWIYIVFSVIDYFSEASLPFLLPYFWSQ